MAINTSKITRGLLVKIFQMAALGIFAVIGIAGCTMSKAESCPQEEFHRADEPYMIGKDSYGIKQAIFPNGDSISLLGVGHYENGIEIWRLPDGRDCPFYAENELEDRDEDSYENSCALAVAVICKGDYEFIMYYDSIEASSVSRQVFEDHDLIIQRTKYNLDRMISPTTVYALIARGSWRTISNKIGQSVLVEYKGKQYEIKYDVPKQVDSSITIQVDNDCYNFDKRLVAVDTNNNKIVGKFRGGQPNKFEFKEIKLSDIVDFEFQIRERIEVKFENVSLLK